jgi:hypothetical protein
MALVEARLVPHLAVIGGVGKVRARSWIDEGIIACTAIQDLLAARQRPGLRKASCCY